MLKDESSISIIILTNRDDLRCGNLIMALTSVEKSLTIILMTLACLAEIGMGNSLPEIIMLRWASTILANRLMLIELLFASRASRGCNPFWIN